MDLGWQVLKNFIRLYVTFFVDEIRVFGQNNIPSGPKIVVANHANSSDAFVLPFLFPEKLYFLAQQDLFNIRFVGQLLSMGGQIPVVKGQGREALNFAKTLIENGKTVVVFPEGMLNHGNEMHRVRSGAAVLALETGVPLLPIGSHVPDKHIWRIKGHFNDRDTFGGWQWGGSYYLNIGKPLNTSDYSCAEDTYRHRSRLSADIMHTVRSLVDQAVQVALSRSRNLPASV
jgi:1-acyl-sn-glycerol-3-phosphate acyltransferase